MAQRLGRQDAGFASVPIDAPASQQHDPTNLRDDLVDVMGHEQDRGSLPRHRADVLHEMVARDDVEAARRFVEHQRRRLVDQRPRDQHAPRFAGGHRVERGARQPRRVNPLERRLSSAPHRVGDALVREQTVGREEAGDHGVQAGHDAVGIAVDEPIVKIGGDDAQLRSQFEHVPAVLAEDPDRRRGRIRSADAIALLDGGILLQREQLDERRLAGAVRAEDGGVLADANGQREAIEDARPAEHDRRVVEFQKGRLNRRSWCFPHPRQRILHPLTGPP